MTKDVGVLGSEDFVLGFQLAGLKRAYKAADAASYQEQVEDILRAPKNLGILIVRAQDLEALSPTTKKKIADSIDPVVVTMGGEGGDLREKIKRAIGIDLGE